MKESMSRSLSSIQQKTGEFMRRRTFISVLLSGLLTFGLNIACAVENDEVMSLDMVAVYEEALSKGLPVMVLFVSNDCENCTIAKDEFILPMQISGEYRNKVIFRIVNLDEGDVRDFTGERINAEAFASRYNLEFFPLLLLVSIKGR